MIVTPLTDFAPEFFLACEIMKENLIGDLLSSLVAQMVKNLPATWEIQVQSLGREDPLEKGMATHSRSLAWEIPWTVEPGGLCSSWGQKSQTQLATIPLPPDKF